MKQLLPFLKPYRKQLILGPLAKFSEAVLELLLPLLMARLIDVGIQTGDGAYIWRMGGLMALTASVGFLCSLFCQYSASVASQGTGTAIREELYRKINMLSQRDMARFGIVTLVNRQTADVTQIQVAVAMLIRLVFRAPFLCIGGVVMAMALDFQLSLVLLIFIPLFAAALYMLVRKTVPLYGKVQAKLDGLSTVLRENLTGVRVVRAFGQTKTETVRFAAANHEQAEAALQAGRFSALLSPVTLLLMNAATICVVWFGGLRINTGHLTQGQMIAFISYITQILLALIVVSNLAVLFTRAAASSARVAAVLNMEPSLTDGAETEMTVNAPVIEFRDVSFSYANGAAQALTGVSFRAEAGQTIGIVGGTGAGKSTLLRLIPRFDDVASGEIRIGGRNVKDWRMADLRQKIGLVPQTALLFAGTVESNLRVGKPDATDLELREAIETAQAAAFLEGAKGGLQAPVVQGGRNFSGGQRQRLTIARALVRKPDILILDDSASALDYVTDAKLRAALRQFGAKATIIVSQRISAVMDADLILVLENGAMAGLGAHEELFRANPVYREICLSQGIDGEADA